MLIDGGGFSSNTIFDLGEKIVAPFLWHKKIGSIDTLILTHPNSDHLNGLIYIAKHFNVKNIWTNNETSKSKSFREFLNVIKDGGIYFPKYNNL